MNTSIAAIARRRRVRRDTRELLLLSQGTPDRIVDISVRRLGLGTNGRSAEVYAAAMAALHPHLAKGGRL